MGNRGVTIAQITGTAEGHIRRFRRPFTRDQALAEIRAISTDPDLLAEAAAGYTPAAAAAAAPSSELRYHAAGVLQLLVDAGADPAAIERHSTARLAKRGGTWLADMADGLNRTVR